MGKIQRQEVETTEPKQQTMTVTVHRIQGSVRVQHCGTESHKKSQIQMRVFFFYCWPIDRSASYVFFHLFLLEIATACDALSSQQSHIGHIFVKGNKCKCDVNANCSLLSSLNVNYNLLSHLDAAVFGLDLVIDHPSRQNKC